MILDWVVVVWFFLVLAALGALVYEGLKLK
jgi:hypothetical protein